MAGGCAVVTYELEHVDARLVEAIEALAQEKEPFAYPMVYLKPRK